MKKLFTLLMIFAASTSLSMSTGCDNGPDGPYEESLDDQGLYEEGIGETELGEEEEE